MEDVEEATVALGASSVKVFMFIDMTHFNMLQHLTDLNMVRLSLDISELGQTVCSYRSYYL